MTILSQSSSTLDETVPSSNSSDSTSTTVTNSIATESAMEKVHSKKSNARMLHSNILLIILGIFMIIFHLGLSISWLFCGYILQNAIFNLELIFILDFFVIFIGILGIGVCKWWKKLENGRKWNAIHWMGCMFGLSFGCFILLCQSVVEFVQTPLYQQLLERVMNVYNEYDHVDIPFTKPPFEGSEMEVNVQKNVLLYMNPICALVLFILLSLTTIFSTHSSYQRFMAKNQHLFTNINNNNKKSQV